MPCTLSYHRIQRKVQEPAREMSNEEISGQSIGDQEYDELDDLLDEDPSKLEQSQGTGESHEINSDKPNDRSHMASGTGVEDPEVKQMIGELEKEFGKLMDQGGSNNNNNNNNNSDSKQQENFKQILEMLDEASRDTHRSNGPASALNGNGSKDVQGPTGFKTVISKTLERLKENGSKVDYNIAQEELSQQDVLTRLLNEFANGEGSENGAPIGEEGVDNAILTILNQMVSKQVLYEPMKEMQAEFSRWFDANATKNSDEELQRYSKQFELVNKIISVYERPTYTDDNEREEIAQLLDELEQLGDTPVMAKGENSQSQDDDEFGGLDQELAQSCKQQ